MGRGEVGVDVRMQLKSSCCKIITKDKREPLIGITHVLKETARFVKYGYNTKCIHSFGIGARRYLSIMLGCSLIQGIH